MKILIAGLKKSYHLKRLKAEGEKRGHTVDGAFAADLIIKADTQGFAPTLPGQDLATYDLVYLMVSKRRWEWYTACFYLQERYRTKIVNQKVIDFSYPYYITPAIDYLYQVKHNFPFPRSVVLFSKKSFDEALTGFSFPLVVKASWTEKGKGVFLVRSRGELDGVAEKALELSPSFVIREFIENDGDIRVFTVGYKAIGAMKRTPKEGEFRSNISQGGRGESFNLRQRPEIQKFAEEVSRVTKTEIAGVDIILDKNTGKPYILEVNASPQFEGLEKYTGVNAAEEIIKYFEAKRRK